MSYPGIIFETTGHVARITLSRPTIDLDMAQSLEEVCNRISQDDDACVVLLTGTGDAFCIGSTLKPGESHLKPAEALAGIDRPVIVAVNGDAIAEGLELALAGDIRLASERARFGLPQVGDGLIPSNGGTQRLPRLVGPGPAFEMILTGVTVDAAQALATGLVNRVFAPDKLASEAESMANDMAAKGPIALRYIKEAINKGIDLTLEQGLRLETDLYFLLQTTADRTEGIKAFLEKREPRFQGK